MSSSKAAAVMGGKAARACDSCLRRRARWYCAADDAFLCQACDASVHSANPLARRHERLRMRPTPSSPLGQAGAASTTSNSKPRRQVAPAAWSKRKARTRRPHVKSVGQLLSRKLVEVPEVGAAAESSEERKAEEENGSEEEQLLYRVPSFDRALAELCSPPPSSSSFSRDRVDGAVDIANNKDSSQVVATTSSPVQQLPDHLAGFGPTDAELREFAADMEALLGQGLDDGNEADKCFYMESLGLTKRPPAAEDGGWVKMEHDGTINNNSHQKGSLLGFAARLADQRKSEAPPADVLGIDFNNSCSPTAVDDEDDEREDSSEQKGTASNNGEDAAADAQFLRRSLDLRLNYEAVIESWGSSPWTDGQRPDGVQLDDFWPHPGMWPPAGGGRPGTGEPLTPRWGADGGREARVSRYREKRQTRLFAKKIRYEVRKLNAEKRPRMKGRFVKRPPSAGGGAAVAAAVT